MNTFVVKLLRCLFVVQRVSNKGRAVKLGKGFTEAVRFNPYNPLSYVLLGVIFIIGILKFGIVEVWRGAENPFKWN